MRAILGCVIVAAASVGTSACGNAPVGETLGESASASTFTNDQPAFEYFRGKGLTAVQAAGIVGNLDQESGVDPTAVQAGGPGRGIAQWSVGGRWDTDSGDNATDYATMEGLPLLSLQLQLDFIWFELTNFEDYGLADLQAATTVSDATIAFETDFEGCGTCDQSTRISYAENVLAAFGSLPADAGVNFDAVASSGDAATTTCTLPSGEMGECLETSACTALGHHVSTPGYCPGPDAVECCTVVDAAAPVDAGHDSSMDAPGPTKPPVDAAVDAAKHEDTGAPGAVIDAAITVGSDASRSLDGAADDAAGPSSSSGGCSTAPGEANAPWAAVAVVGSAWFARRRRRSRQPRAS